LGGNTSTRRPISKLFGLDIEGNECLFGNVFFKVLNPGDIAFITTTADKPPKYPLIPN
jgi:hypothetical protein